MSNEIIRYIPKRIVDRRRSQKSLYLDEKSGTMPKSFFIINNKGHYKNSRYYPIEEIIEFIKRKIELRFNYINMEIKPIDKYTFTVMFDRDDSRIKEISRELIKVYDNE